MININERFDYWCEKLRIRPFWDIELELIDDPSWPKTGDLNLTQQIEKLL